MAARRVAAAATAVAAAAGAVLAQEAPDADDSNIDTPPFTVTDDAPTNANDVDAESNANESPIDNEQAVDAGTNIQAPHDQNGDELADVPAWPEDDSDEPANFESAGITGMEVAQAQNAHAVDDMLQQRNGVSDAQPVDDNHQLGLTTLWSTVRAQGALAGDGAGNGSGDDSGDDSGDEPDDEPDDQPAVTVADLLGRLQQANQHALHLHQQVRHLNMRLDDLVAHAQNNAQLERAPANTSSPTPYVMPAFVAAVAGLALVAKPEPATLAHATVAGLVAAKAVHARRDKPHA